MENPSRRRFLNASLAATAVSIAAPNIVLGAAAKVDSAGGPVVETHSGKIRGAFANKVYTFKGVPYGASTAGANRWQPPQKVQPWTGVKDTLELGLRSPQVPSFIVPEWAVLDRTEPTGEDCLCLNGWTPALDGKKRPVMFWLHGGGFAGGSDGFTAYDGTELARKHDVVVVGINHRLNVVGFLYLADLGNSQFANASNAGMLDAVAALEWTRDNIANFGGDPGNVTIFGQSGGGRKVSTLLGMPAAKGLFHRAIVQSGSQLNGLTREAATKNAEALLQRLGLDKSKVEQLQQIPMRKILQAMQGGNGPRQAGGGINFAPVVDGKSLPADMFVPTASLLSADVPTMIGCTETESTWNTSQQYDPLTDADLRERVAETLRTSEDEAARVIAVYKKNQPSQSNLDIFLILASDASTRTAAITQGERKSVHKAPTYMYLFNWRSPVRDGRLRSMHTMDIPFVYDNVDVAKSVLGANPDRYKLADQMSAAWVAFARTGNPNHKGIPNWAPYNTQARATMIWNTPESKVVNDPSKEELAALASVKRQGPAGPAGL
jgi:para-nitrobenzyl esterase